jgi:predicted TIM-barrel fold metal-dependent hydrolase
MMGNHMVRWVGLEAMEEYEREERHYKGARYETGRIGKFESEARKRDLAVDDVQAEVIYGFSYWMDQPDREVLVEMCKVYNDWLHEFCADTSDRSVAVAMLPSFDVEESVAEAKRVKQLHDAQAVSIAMPYVGEIKGGYRSADYDPLWTVIADLDMPLANHVGTGGAYSRSPGPGQVLLEQMACQIDASQQLMEFVAAGIFERFPTLRLAVVEGGCGWLPWYLVVMDRMWEDNGAFFRPKLSKPPSRYVHDNCLVTFQEDPPGMRSLEDIRDCIAWGSDYPHREGTFPHSREKIEACMGGLPLRDRAQICAENAARFFRLDLDSIVKKYGPQSEHARTYGDTDGGARRIALSESS